ncbi:MAG: hypothetical protein U0836_23520 [Pirellulales bacterium]
MTVEQDIPAFLQWLPPALLGFALAAAAVAFLALVFGYVIAAARHGPVAAGDITYRVVSTGVADLLRTSPRRVFAIAKLAVQESIRRRVIVVFAVFLAILLFAGWYLDDSVADPGKLYLSFVLSWTSYLVLLLALFLSVFSLPNDIKNRTIYTIVTKPVRPGEIVLGRILGFTFVGTLLLACMGVASYVFVVRAVDHSHGVVEVDAADAATAGLKLRSTTDHNHRHDVLTDKDGNYVTDFREGHWHEIESQTSGDKTSYTVGPPLGVLVAREPLYAAKLSFLDRNGKPTDKGVNTGNEWMYRSFIEGGSQAAAIWSFEGVTPTLFPRDRFPDGLPLELTIRVFRTHKGNIEKGVAGGIVLRNPQTGVSTEQLVFLARDYHVDTKLLKWEQKDSKGKPLDLMKDLVSSDGKLEVILTCIDPAQYFGMAKADVYLKARDASFTWNFIKGFAGIWSQMVLVIGFGVMYSTFLNGAVAMMATLGTIVVGFFASFIARVIQGTYKGAETVPDAVMGGGPIESLIRIVTQKNVMTALEESPGTTVAKMLDQGLLFMMSAVGRIAPNFGALDNSDYVAYGYNIPADMVGEHLVTVLGYLLALFVAGYFFLKTREVAK